MSNTPFNQQITNALERPTSSGLNLGFANYDVQALAYSLMMQSGSYPDTGFVGSSFQVVPLSPASTTQVGLSRGLGFYEGTSGPNNISSITGLNDAFDYKAVYTEARTLNVAPPCSAGKIRRDLIMVKPKVTLTDTATTDIYQPSVNSFAPQNRYRTLSRDFTNEIQYTLAAGVLPSENQNLVYKMGVEVSAAGGFASAPIPSIDAGYMSVAVINVADAAPGSGYTETRINDTRRMTFAGGSFNVVGNALIGTVDGSPPSIGAVLAGVNINSLPSIRVAIRKTGGNNFVRYQVYIVAGLNYFNMSGSVNRKAAILTGSAYDSGAYAAPIDLDFTYVSEALQSALLDSSQTVPVLPVAVGQQVYTYEFAVGAPTQSGISATGIKWNTAIAAFGFNGATDIFVNDIDFNIAFKK